MKKIKFSILVLLLAGFASNASAQDSPFRFGAKAGVNFSKAFVDFSDHSKFRTGYQIGVTGDYSLSSNFLIQAELLFSKQGSKQKSDLEGIWCGTGVIESLVFDQLYINLPIFASYKTNVSSNIALVFGAGPYLGYGVGGKTKLVGLGGFDERKQDTFGKDWKNLNRFDFGAGVKADLEYKKYVLGLGASTSIINNANNNHEEDFKYRNLNLNVSLGYKF